MSVRYLKSLPPVVKTSGNFNVFKWTSPLPQKANAQVQHATPPHWCAMVPGLGVACTLSPRNVQGL